MKQFTSGPFGRAQQIAIIIGAVGLVLCVIGLFINSAQTLQSYLFAYIYWAGLGLGCLGMLMIQFTARSTWGRVIRRLAEAGALTVPLLGILIVPVLLAVVTLYPWARADVVAASAVLRQKAAYLNIPFFIIRTVVFFAAWTALAYGLRRLSLREDSEANPGLFQRMQNLSIAGLVVLAITVTFAMIDWVMSLEPEWSSTIYAMMVAMGGLLAALALIVVCLTRLRDHEAFKGIVTPGLLNDFGNLLMAGLLMWAYLAFSQYMVIWTGNLSDEIPWYLRRLAGSWQVVVLLVIILHFGIPFIGLLSPQVKRSPRALGIIAGLLVVMHMVDTFWLVIPALRQNGFALAWTDIAAAAGVGGLWVAAFLWQLGRRALIARNTAVEVKHSKEAAVNG